MKSTGNGLPQLCLVNLFRMTRGEVRFDVLRGMDSSITEKPETAARPLLIAEGYWLAAQYEPRISFNGIDVDGMPELGNYDLTANGTI